MSSTNGIDQAFQIKEKLADLQDRLEANAPGLATLLRDIHQTLKKDPDVVTLLSEEDCAVIVQGLKKQTATEIATSALKNKSGKKAMSKMTVGDL